MNRLQLCRPSAMIPACAPSAPLIIMPSMSTVSSSVTKMDSLPLLSDLRVLHFWHARTRAARPSKRIPVRDLA
jgi:hypothetical protein